MATTEQVQNLIDLVTKQMTEMKSLSEENARLRVVNAAANNPATTNTPPNESRYKSKKPDRPIIDCDLDDQEWVLFLDTWERYKTMIDLSSTDVNAIRMELRAACSADVNKLLFEYVGAVKLNSCTEDELLAYIKSVAVKVTHKEVHRVEFAKMAQNQGEKVTRYIARLKAKAFLCKFEIKCSCNPATVVSYADERVSERLIAGLQNQEHQRKILAEAGSLITLEQKSERLQVLESTEESASILHTDSPRTKASANATRSASTYKSWKKGKHQPDSAGSPSKCRWCGKTSHGPDKTMDKVHCPAREKDCNYCHKKGHLASVCEKRESQAASAEVENIDDQPLPDIPAEASVSFAFATEETTEPSPEDFRHSWRPTKNR